MNTRIHYASASFPGFRHAESVALVAARLRKERALAGAHCQLCPQHNGLLAEEAVASLMRSHPKIQFRLHANARVCFEFGLYDASTPFTESRAYFEQVGRVSTWLHAPAYSLHAGRRQYADLKTMADNARRVQDLVKIPVAVEGLYPAGSNQWLVSSWPEYEWLLNSGLNMAIDLSHLMIVARHSRERRDDLVRALLASPRTLEIHISSNDGRRDSHRQVSGQEWWWPLLEAAHPQAMIFSEGIIEMPARRGVPRPSRVARAVGARAVSA